jgi:2-haloacid dehalogenase
LDASEVSDLMQAYDVLSTFPDVDPALKALRKSPNITSVVFSNGTHAMVHASVTKSPSLAPHASIFKDIVVVEEVRKFKPAPEVYWHLVEKVGKTREQIGDVWLISANPFDIVGAGAVGIKAVWVDRGGTGWVDSLGEGEKGRPTVVVKGLDEVVDAVLKYSGA